ncbi:hypothetical protein NE237_012384 [Protea cynaroides]|uniref:Uncharacterized protein n=1 Tax=Protea cynaroides TaxID=273540 RepID=A0A9Q0GZ04_9MAGN|nr:hypothetical protein NE237_012384 [Protea cynaroides]
MKCLAKEIDGILGNWLDDHHNKETLLSDHNDHQDFMDVMLSILPEDELIYGYDRDTVVKATVLNLIVDRQVDESDIKNLIYLQAIVKETLRLYPPGPVLPHQAMEDYHVAGYHVSKDTILLMNIWKLQRDPNVWSDPDEFRPERFLTTHAEIDFKTQQHEYIPFSAGRRICPGITFVTQVFHLALARLLHGFAVMCHLHESVDMREGLGIILPKASRLQVLLSPCLPSKLYEG